MKPHRLALLLTLGAFAASAQEPVVNTLPVTALPVPATNEAQEVLVQQARYWQARERPDLAAEAWQRLLQSNPAHEEALYQLGLLAAGRGDSAAATRYLERLTTGNPASPQIAGLSLALKRGPVDAALIERARQFGRQQNPERAAELYRAAFMDGPPPANLALEYYQTLGGTSDGWAEARKGLETLAAAAPRDKGIALSLARHLTYREETRRDAIARLMVLARDPTFAKDATAAGRQALLWLGGQPEDVGLYQDYLLLKGSDPAVEARLADIRSGGSNPAAKARREAFGLLERNDATAAALAFESQLKAQPDDSDLRGGLGVAQLRLGRFQEAADNLNRAIAAAPDRADRWKQAQDSATYWAGIADARADQKAGRIKEGIAKARTAVSLAPAGDMTGRMLLAELLARSRNLTEAEQEYRAILQLKPDNVAAKAALADVLRRHGQPAEATRLLNSVPTGQLPAYAVRTQAELLRTQAAAADQSGRTDEARTLLRRAVEMDPAAPWPRLDYARLLDRAGQTEEARAVVEPLMQGPQSVDILKAVAFWHLESGRKDAAALVLGRIPDGSLSANSRALRRRLEVEGGTARARSLAATGQINPARQVLEAALVSAGDDPAALGEVINAIADIGAPDRAMALGESRLAPRVTQSVPTALAYATLLLKSDRNEEMDSLLTQVEQRPGLSPVDQAAIRRLRNGSAIRQADAARTTGQMADGYDYLTPALVDGPDDPELLMALARLYQANRQPQDALALYEQVLQRDPGNSAALAGSVDTNLALSDPQAAESRVVRALRQRPNSPDLLLLFARVQQARGNTDQALAALDKAERLAGPRRSAIDSRAFPRINPFRDTADPPQLRPALSIPGSGGAGGPMPSVTADIQRLRQEINQQSSFGVEAGFGLRHRNGDPGLGRLTATSMDLTVGMPMAGARLSLTVTPTNLNAGDLNLSDLRIARQFGSLATLDPATSVKVPSPQCPSGKVLFQINEIEKWVAGSGSCVILSEATFSGW
jgi:cellulose synthase operon protein C